MKKILKIVLTAVLSLAVVGCSSSSTSDETSANILCPTGAPALGLVSEYENICEEGKVDFVEGSDTQLAELAKEDSEYDIIICPINVGVQVMSKGDCNYKLAGVLTWGNLYILAENEDVLQGEGEIALFGQGAVPEKIYTLVSDSLNVTLEENYYSEASLVQQQLISGNAVAGLLAEPAATATLGKAKEAGIDLQVVADLQALYGDGEGYPQAAVFIKEDEHYDSLLESIDEFTNNDYPDLQEYVEAVGFETLGVPSVEVAVNSIERQNIHYKSANDCIDEITDFLATYDIEFSDDMIHD